MKREELSNLIFNKLNSKKEELSISYQQSKKQIGYFYIDDLLPEEIVRKIFKSFPKPQEMKLKKSLKEYKHIAVQMNQYEPLLEEIIYAFQDVRIVELFKNICGTFEIFPDKNLYAGGLSAMSKDHFLNPHLDNSHDKNRSQWRVLNLLFYVTPNWNLEDGGHLEIWPNGLDQKPITIESKFNRLVVMATHQTSWHSVSPIRKDGIRCCVSNYYFSPNPLKDNDSFHVTTFRGRPNQKFRNSLLKVDSTLRMGIRKVFKKGIVENPHVYKKEE